MTHSHGSVRCFCQFNQGHTNLQGYCAEKKLCIPKKARKLFLGIKANKGQNVSIFVVTSGFVVLWVLSKIPGFLGILSFLRFEGSFVSLLFVTNTSLLANNGKVISLHRGEIITLKCKQVETSKE